MRKIKFLIVGCSLLVLGLVTSVVTLAVNQFDVGELADDLISKTYDIEGDFNKIECDLDITDLSIYLSNDGVNRAVCLEKENITFDIKVEDQKLKIVEDNQSKWWEFSYYSHTDIMLFLTKETYESLSIDTDTGDIDVSDAFTFENVNINGSTGEVIFGGKVEEKLTINLSTGEASLFKVQTKDLEIKITTGKISILESLISNNANLSYSTGNVYIKDSEVNGDFTVIGKTGDIFVENMNSKNVNIKLSTGECELIDFIASGDMKVESSTGSIKLDGCDAANLEIKTSTGNINGTLLTSKIFNAVSDTGKVSVPETYSGGICKLTSDTGNISISYK